MSWKSMLGFTDEEPAAKAVEVPPGETLISPDSDEGEEVKEPPVEVPAQEVPGLEWWWLIEHAVTPKTRSRFVGGPALPDFEEIPPSPEELSVATPHPAFYLRTLMPGDFAPGRLPAPRHVRPLQRGQGLPTEIRCGTCGEIPRSEDLEPVERQTGHRGFLGDFRSGRARWPKPTAPGSCWMCSGQAPANTEARLRGTDVLVCAACAKHLERSA